jgi:hypothetical protein
MSHIHLGGRVLTAPDSAAKRRLCAQPGMRSVKKLIGKGNELTRRIDLEDGSAREALSGDKRDRAAEAPGGAEELVRQEDEQGTAHWQLAEIGQVLGCDHAPAQRRPVR